MKLSFAFATIVLAVSLLSSPAYAAEKAAKKTCCEAAKAEKKECTHKCCVSAQRAGKVCEKCNPGKAESKKNK